MNFNKPAFDNLYEFAKRAFKSSCIELDEENLQVAGNNLRFVFAERTLINQLLRPLKHQIVNKNFDECFTLMVWEDSDVPIETYLRFMNPKTTEVPFLCSENYHVSLCWNEFSQAYALQILDFCKGEGIFWKDKNVDIPKWDLFSPFRSFFHNFLLTKNQLMFHAGALGISGRGVMLVGKGGSGKSSTILSCINSAFSILSDDYLVTSSEGELCGTELFSLYSSTKLLHSDIERMSFLDKLVDKEISKDSYKAIIYLNEVAPNSFVNKLKLEAILVPCVTGHTATYLSSLPDHELLTALITSSVSQIPQKVSKFCEHSKKMADTIPCYKLNLGTDIPGISKCILDLLCSSSTV